MKNLGPRLQETHRREQVDLVRKKAVEIGMVRPVTFITLLRMLDDETLVLAAGEAARDGSPRWVLPGAVRLPTGELGARAPR